MALNIIFTVLIAVPMSHCAIPGTFFWKPRLGLDLALPTTEFYMEVKPINKANVREGLVVLIDGYQGGMTIVALAVGISSAQPYLHLNPLSSYFYTNAYRWGLRHFSMLPFWLGGTGDRYTATHKVWRRRFFYMDHMVPKWLRVLFPFVKEEEWKREEDELKRFKTYAEPAFGKFYRYPSKTFNNFQSQMTQETVDVDDSDQTMP